MSEISVRDNPGRGRFEIVVDGEVAGYSEYDDSDPGARAFVHTVTEEPFQGRGLAGVLAAAALDATRRAGMIVEPYCPYMREFIAKHPEYLDLVPPDRRSEFDLDGP